MAERGICGAVEKGRKTFFSEEKKQNTFNSFVGDSGA
jgi:hypothetical protein